MTGTWSAEALVEHPDVVREIHSSFITVGAYANVLAGFKSDYDMGSQGGAVGETPPHEDLDPGADLIFAQKWRSLGAAIIGVCCGIGPDHIAELSRTLA